MMAQVDNKVEWCLKKAEKELKESPWHRGLVRIKPSLTEAQKHVEKAEHNLKAAQFFNDNGYSDWSASAFFYCIYHCFLAILLKYGYESRNQECTLAVIEMLIEKDIIDLELKYLNLLNLTKAKEMDHNLIKIREEFQYGTGTSYQKVEEFEYFVKTCQEMIHRTKEIINRKEKE